MRLGTRGSALALAQAGWVAERLGGECEIVTITTTGDRGVEIGDKSRWVGELEQALLEDRIDVAVHSAKDVPAELAAGLCIAAVPQRAAAQDVLCGARSLGDLAPGARVGTSSLRREAQLRARDASLEVLPVRGNVDTRLRRLREGHYDALVLALAGLQRLGRERDAGGVLEEMVPAAGQGALALQTREELAGDERLRALADPRAEAELAAEREVVRLLGASCNTPIGVRATCEPVGGEVELRAWVGLPDGSAWLSDARRGAPLPVAGELVSRLRSAGADDLLREAERRSAA